MKKLARELTAKGRNQIAEGNFALPDRRYPIHDESHARNALARVAQHGTSGEQAQVRAAVKSKYPGIEQEKEALWGDASMITRPGMLGNYARSTASMGMATPAQNKEYQNQRAQGRISAFGRLKKASLCQQIAGTLNATDFERFNAEYENRNIREMVEKSAMVGECLGRLVSQPVVSAEKLASAVTARPSAMDVVQVVPDGYGYRVKFSAAPNNVAPKEVKMSPQEAQQALPPEALQTADAQGAATMTGVEAEPDPMIEPPPAPIDGFGLYKCFEQGTGRQILGFVIPGLYDPRIGGPTDQSVFVNGGQYALQPSFVGNLVGMNFNLPHSETIRGLGIFYKTNGKALMATVPYAILTEVTVEGRTYYAAQDPTTGEEVQITVSEGLKKPLATSPGEIVIPGDFQFLALDNPIMLEGAETQQDPMAQQKVASASSMVEIRAWDGGCKLSGPVFEKVGSGDYDWVDGLFWMAAAGIPQNLGVALLEKAASDRHALRIYGCRPLSPMSETVKEASAAAQRDMLNTKIPKRYCLLKEATLLGDAIALNCESMGMSKEAAAMVGTDSVDAVLALNFINPENVSTFLESLPQLEEASTKIAALVLATQLGLHAIPKTAATRAMFALEDVISGLKTLQEHRI